MIKSVLILLCYITHHEKTKSYSGVSNPLYAKQIGSFNQMVGRSMKYATQKLRATSLTLIQSKWLKNCIKQSSKLKATINC